MYFGLQTGWVSTMTMPASLLGFGIFRLLRMAIMPLGCGFVGVLPAMNYLLREDEQGPIVLGTGKLVLWSLGLCYFGVVFAVPLRRQVIIRERLRFPSGFSTAVLIGVLHGQAAREGEAGKGEGFASLAGEVGGGVERNIPVFGSVAANTWLWTLNPSLAYVGQGIIMGPATTLHMLLGAVVGWGILSPLAKSKGWAPAPVGDWENGSKGWIVWTSLAIMLADAVVSLGYLALRSGRQYVPQLRDALQLGLLPSRVKTLLGRRPQRAGYTPVNAAADEGDAVQQRSPRSSTSSDGDDIPLLGELEEEKEADDAPLDQQVSDRLVAIGLVLSILFCILCIHIVFGNLVPLYATVTAVFMALVLSIMGVRALGETDLNPVSGISKLAQLFFAVIIPQSNKSSVLINLVAGAVSEAGALQAGDMMQDLKTGHLLGAAPKAQFWGQVVGATVGAVVSAFIYRLYTS
ncbi:hypothetical protein NEMBOFW57_004327 [Staphylotrichum longicolle]|uniref:Oligonucleotide transporter n=1 Tax=Staphylotrichum longicolle TaxID=669026 RepID=A0AAD4I3I9_9PEZI|nr:hypothetical protein NEMBOFW57_004327 [Staphylotrichum longicolle]